MPHHHKRHGSARFIPYQNSLVSAFISPETGSKKVDAIIGDKSNIVVIGNIAITELYSAISKKYRIGEIFRQDFLSAIYRFEDEISKIDLKFFGFHKEVKRAAKSKASFLRNKLECP